jgi:hypothetical protein
MQAGGNKRAAALRSSKECPEGDKVALEARNFKSFIAWLVRNDPAASVGRFLP